MRYLNGVFGLCLIMIAVLHIGRPAGGWWMIIYSAGAVISLACVLPKMNLWFHRVLCWGCTLAMFGYFAAFFMIAPYGSNDWYVQPAGREALALLFAGFTMIPALSEWSCRLKATCPEHHFAPLRLRRRCPNESAPSGSHHASSSRRQATAT